MAIPTTITNRVVAMERVLLDSLFAEPRRYSIVVDYEYMWFHPRYSLIRDSELVFSEKSEAEFLAKLRAIAALEQ